jgi:FKBP-type peptidyl-prolyl cis-trans isomerase
MSASCGSNSSAPDGADDADDAGLGDGEAPSTIDSGLPGTPPMRVEALAWGSGARPKIGQVVGVHYTGTFEDGRKFDSSRDSGRPLTFAVGTGKVIKGWDMALLRMRVGDRWKVSIPYQLAYGERGHPAGIPPKADLLFDMELMSIR